MEYNQSNIQPSIVLPVQQMVFNFPPSYYFTYCKYMVEVTVNTYSNNNKGPIRWDIRESVDSLCRDGADAQYMQYLSKSRITSPQTR